MDIKTYCEINGVEFALLCDVDYSPSETATNSPDSFCLNSVTCVDGVDRVDELTGSEETELTDRLIDIINTPPDDGI